MSEIDRDFLLDKLDELRLEHRDLDEIIDYLQHAGAIEQLQLQRMKRRKLKIKDQIADIENQLIPDILA
ncbi:MAG: DUF465 domain-containing protein [Gammaproteobacteria bacterium]|nr:DUF465 domain-containing protein [Gammaproteobacteria bacterium]